MEGRARSIPKIGDSVSLTVEKYDPSRDSAPRLETCEIPCTKEMRVLEALDRQHIRTATGRGARHPAPILADALDRDPAPEHPA